MDAKFGALIASLVLAAPLTAQYRDSTTVRTVVQCPAIPVDTLLQRQDSTIALLLRPAAPPEAPKLTSCAVLLDQYRKDHAGFSGAVRKWAPTVAAVFAVGTFIAVLVKRRQVVTCPACQELPPEAPPCDDDDD